VVNARVIDTLQNRPLQTELRTQPRFKERKTVSFANSPSKKNKDNLNYCQPRSELVTIVWVLASSTGCKLTLFERSAISTDVKRKSKHFLKFFFVTI
jgi:hypothetical protein